MTPTTEIGEGEPFLPVAVQLPRRAIISRSQQILVVVALGMTTVLLVCISRSVVSPIAAKKTTVIRASNGGEFGANMGRNESGVASTKRTVSPSHAAGKMDRVSTTKKESGPNNRPSRKEGLSLDPAPLRDSTRAGKRLAKAQNTETKVTLLNDEKSPAQLENTTAERNSNQGKPNHGAQPMPKIYMLYNPVNGQLFSQYNALVNFLVLGAKLDCCVVVLPSIGQNGMESLEPESELRVFSEETAANDILQDKGSGRWGNLFDVPALRRATGLDIMEMADFVKLPEWKTRGESMARLLYTKAEIDDPRQSGRTQSFWDHLGFRSQRDDKRLGSMDVCDLSRTDRQAELLAHKIRGRRESVVLLGSMVRNCESEMHKNISKALVPVQSIRSTTSVFLKSLRRAPGHCLHVRFSEGDCVRSSRNLAPVVKQRAKSAIPAGDGAVYVSFHPRFKSVRTAAAEFLSERKGAAVTQAGMRTAIESQASGAQRLMRGVYGAAVLDAWTCAQADHLLGSTGSAMSMRIGKWMQGRNENATVGMYTAPLKTDKSTWDRNLSTC